MTQTPSDYIRSHGLLRKYGWGLAIIALAGLASTLNGDPASLLTLKMMIAIPFAIAVAWLPTIFDPVRSRLPFTPSFVERSFLEGLYWPSASISPAGRPITPRFAWSLPLLSPP
ncbi:hypothetical protein [Devosia sp. Root685]|uniref:hypothetical protein n=1 Tax=Devosia sp. Root685 TaxID=1736587 RepID=UPI0012E3784E|nr:hypothetical protein [Devosia sp. Root685]